MRRLHGLMVGGRLRGWDRPGDLRVVGSLDIHVPRLSVESCQVHVARKPGIAVAVVVDSGWNSRRRTRRATRAVERCK